MKPNVLISPSILSQKQPENKEEELLPLLNMKELEQSIFSYSQKYGSKG